jgi:PilZ domain-containing protein
MTEQRSYRKSLSSKVLLYLGEQEIEMTIKNLSLTGLLAMIPKTSAVPSVEELMADINNSSVVDLYISELRVGGEAKIVRAESTEEYIEIGLQFRQLNYEVDNLIYARHAYRKQIGVPGQVEFHGVKHLFNTENVSVTGMKVRMAGKVGTQPGDLTQYEVDALHLSGDAKVVWLKHDNHTTLMGLEYQYMQQDVMQGIPRFIH